MIAARVVGLDLGAAGGVEAFGQLGPQLVFPVGGVVPAVGAGDVVADPEPLAEELPVATGGRLGDRRPVTASSWRRTGAQPAGSLSAIIAGRPDERNASYAD